jgi:hypothetical protein
LQRLRRLRYLRIVGGETDHRKAEYRKPARDHRGCEQHIPLVSAFAVVRRHIVHREFVRGTNGRWSALFPREPGDPAR